MRIDREVGLAAALLAVSLFFLVHLVGAPAADAGFVSTTTVPTWVAAALVALSVVLLIGVLTRAPAAPDDRTEGSDRAAAWRVIAMVAGTAVYAALMPWLGYLASSAVCIAGLAWLYGTRRWLTILALAAIVPLSLMIFFERYMIVLLPSARLFD